MFHIKMSRSSRQRIAFWLCCGLGLAAWMACGISRVSAQGIVETIRVVTYNIEDDISGATTPLPGLIAPSGGTVQQGGVLEGIGEEILGGDPAQPLDILALEETTSNSSTVAPIVTGMNSFYNAPGMYAMSTHQATESGGVNDDGNGPNAIVYNTRTLQLLASVPVDPPGGTGNLGSTSGEYREVMRYEFAPAGVTPTPANEFYVYVSHYKSGTTSTDLTDRAGEARIIRNDEASNLPASARVLYVGDYNVTTSGETSYQTILAASSPSGVSKGQGFDPMNPQGSNNINWGTSTTNKTVLAMETESATDLRYRDDLELMTSNVYYGVPGGLALVPGTYHVFGNNGTTTYNGSVNSGTNTALNNDLEPGAPISAATLYANLTTASDHLPVVADYTLPVAQPPLASFTADPTNGTAPLTVAFSNLSADATNYLWTFGDGNTSTLVNPANTYTNPGIFSVTLMAIGAGGTNAVTYTNYISVSTPPPLAGFTATPTNGTAPLTVTFSNLSSDATNYLWAFGDGNTSTLINPANFYTNPGLFSVTLMVVGAGGTNVVTYTNYISVAPAPLPSLFLGSAVLSASGSFQFTASNADGTPITALEQTGLTVYVATNLGLDPTNWTVLNSQGSLSNGVFQIIDSNAFLFPQRYYRVQAAP